MRKGKYKHRNTCRLCGNSNLELFLDLGWVPLAGDYLKKIDIGKELYYPLRIYYCQNCFLVQLSDIISPDILFKDYRYLSSIGLSSHFKNYAEEMMNRFLTRKSFAVEIGSNDGVLLVPLKEYRVRVLGIDPAENVAWVAQRRGIETIADYFTEKNAIQIVKKHGQADAVFANNVLAHIDNMHDVAKGIKRLLKPGGVFVFEVHYLVNLIEKLQYDFFYPGEHLSYYSLLSLIPFWKSYGLEIFDVKRIPIHSGSIRVYMYKKGKSKRVETEGVSRLVAQEKKLHFDHIEPFSAFADKVFIHKENLYNYLMKLYKKGKKLVGYGAAGRGNTLLNVCGISKKILSYIVDESPERYGRFTPGTHIPIVRPDVFRKDNPDYALLLAWSYKDTIFKKEKEFLKRGGEFIVPLPNIQIISKDTIETIR